MENKLNKNKGFTLIELLAVIVVLAIVALISVPIVLNSIQTVRTGAKIETARGIVKAAEFYCAEELLGGNIITSLNDINLIDYTGTDPDSFDLDFDENCKATGSVLINSTKINTTESGDVEIASSFVCGDNFIDTRDSKTYSTVQIGEQCWFAENLAYADSGCLTETFDSNMGCRINGGSGWDKDEVLYQWQAAMDGSSSEGAQGLCPTDWYIPTKTDFDTLLSLVNENDLVHSDWLTTSTNEYGFNFLPVGYRSWNFSLEDVGNFSALLSSTSYEEIEYAMPFGLSVYIDSDFVFLYEWAQEFSHSVRCILGS